MKASRFLTLSPYDWRRDVLHPFRAVILALMITGTGICHSRNAISPALNSHRHGDCLDRTRVAYVPPGAAGTGIVWSADNAGILGRYVSRISVFSDTVMAGTPDAAYYYRENADSLSLTGYENRKSRILYDMPRLIRPSAMQYGDSILGYYSGRGSYCGKLYFDIAGFQYTVADACGVIVADGDTIPEVLRVHCHRGEILRPREKSSLSGIIDVDSVRSLLDTIPPQIIEDTWLWFAAGCRYPVMETVDIRGRNDVHTDENPHFTYLFLPYAQTMSLAYDSENSDRRRNITKSPAMAGAEDSPPSSFPVDADMSLSNDGRTLTVSYRQDFKGEVRFVACDTRGRLLCSVTRMGDAGTHDISMELTRPPVGNVVVVHVEADGMHISRKVYKETF